MPNLDDPWDVHADWWRANFTRGADPEYEDQIFPLVTDLVGPAPGMRVLDAGCGEGHITRLLADAGAEVVGVDASSEQIQGAERESGASARYVQASLQALPLAAASLDAVCVVLVLEHIKELAGAIAELARVARPGARVVVFLNHPLFQTPDSGWVDDHILEEQYWRVGAYLDEVSTEEEIDRGVVLAFHHRPLSRYVNAFIENGCSLEAMHEPAPPTSFLALAPEYAQSATIPRLAVLVFSKIGGTQLAGQN